MRWLSRIGADTLVTEEISWSLAFLCGQATIIDNATSSTKNFNHGSLLMAKTYRRRENNDTWHFCKNCSNWPRQDYVERETKPTTGELCNECIAKERNGTCSN